MINFRKLFRMKTQTENTRPAVAEISKLSMEELIAAYQKSQEEITEVTSLFYDEDLKHKGSTSENFKKLRKLEAHIKNLNAEFDRRSKY